MQAQPTAPSGSVFYREAKGGAKAYAAIRLNDPADSRRTRLIGAAHVQKIADGWKPIRSRPPAGVLTISECEAQLAGMLAEITTEITTAPEHDELTFGQAVDAWLDRTEHVDKRRVSTLRDYRGTADTILRPHFHDETRLSDITRREVQAFADGLARATFEDGRQRYAKRTVQKSLVLLGRIFRVAMIEHEFPVNPVALVTKGTVPKGEVVYWTHAEVATIAEHADEQDADLFVVMSRIGLRRGEIIALRWRHVDFEGEQILVRENRVEGATTSPKDHETRDVPLQDDAAEILARLSLRDEFTAPDDLVFPNDVGEHQNSDNLSKRFTAARKSAGLEDHPGSLENLRHSFATYAADTPGVTPADVQRWLGHSDLKTTMRYVGVLQKRDAAKLLTARSQAEPERVAVIVGT
jgi:integrase